LFQWKDPSVAFCSIPAALVASSLFHTLLLTDKKWSTDFHMHNVVSLDWLRGTMCGKPGRRQYRCLLKQSTPLGQNNAEADFTFASPDVQLKKKGGKRSRKQETPLVDTMVRRSTRSSAQKDGYMHKVLPDTRATPAKKRKVQKNKEQEEVPSVKIVRSKRTQKEKFSAVPDSNSCDLPPTPISVMQRVGLALGMEATDLTKEKFMTAPDDKAPTDVPNE
jgi:hypothetical protein